MYFLKNKLGGNLLRYRLLKKHSLYVTCDIQTITKEIGLLVDTEDKDYAELPEPHLSRLVDVVSGDGWMDAVVGE